MPVRVIARFALSYLVALVAVTVVGVVVEFPPGVSVVLAPFFAAFRVAPIHVRAIGRSLRRTELFVVTVLFSIASAVVTSAALVVFLAMYFVFGTGSLVREIGEVLRDPNGWRATLALIYVVFIIVLAPFLSTAYKFFYARALRELSLSGS